jgi:hypothetical protein
MRAVIEPLKVGMGTRGSLLEDFAPQRKTQRNADNRVWTLGRQGAERLKECRLDMGRSRHSERRRARR